MMTKQQHRRGAPDAGLFQWRGSVSFGQVLPLGMQHVVAAVVSTVGPALMVSKNCQLDGETTTLLVQMALLMTAFSTLIMLFPVTRYVGSALPVIMGVGFTIPTLMS
ncbi:MAG: purine permease, partial [Oscillospiraceae bacterium]|nr:purine permease [Oscillospiraceae bacterium]